MKPDPKYPQLSVESLGVLSHATAYREDGAQVGGHLAVDQEGHVIFVADQPDHDPEKE